MPLTGHRYFPVAPRKTLTPLWSGSVLDCLIMIFNCRGFTAVDGYLPKDKMTHHTGHLLGLKFVNMQETKAC